MEDCGYTTLKRDIRMITVLANLIIVGFFCAIAGSSIPIPIILPSIAAAVAFLLVNLHIYTRYCQAKERAHNKLIHFASYLTDKYRGDGIYVSIRDDRHSRALELKICQGSAGENDPRGSYGSCDIPPAQDDEAFVKIWSRIPPRYSASGSSEEKENLLGENAA
jgi:hypothetical protein